MGATILQSQSQGTWPITSWELGLVLCRTDDVRSTVQSLVKCNVQHVVKCSLLQLKSLSVSLEGLDDMADVEQALLSAQDVESICQDLAGAAWSALDSCTPEKPVLGINFGLAATSWSLPLAVGRD